MDTITRKPEPVAEETVLTGPKHTSIGPIETGVEVPYTDYEVAHRKPFSVEYFNLGNLWDDPQGGFSEEIGTLEKYFTSKIEKGELANSVSAVKNELKELEKTNNMKHEERVTVKLGTLAAYVKFLMETEGIKYSARKYGQG